MSISNRTLVQFEAGRYWYDYLILTENDSGIAFSRCVQEIREHGVLGRIRAIKRMSDADTGQVFDAVLFQVNAYRSAPLVLLKPGWGHRMQETWHQESEKIKPAPKRTSKDRSLGVRLWETCSKKSKKPNSALQLPVANGPDVSAKSVRQHKKGIGFFTIVFRSLLILFSTMTVMVIILAYKARNFSLDMLSY